MESSYSCTGTNLSKQNNLFPHLAVHPDTVKECDLWFEQYVDRFLNNSSRDQNILLKKEHTLNVVNEMQYLTDSFSHSQASHELAHLVALFHDIGRFRQYIRFGTFADRLSVNHAREGVLVLKQEGILTKITALQSRVLLTAIAQHNRVHVRTRREPYRFFCQLVRDADKLDIYRLVLEYYERSESEQRNAGIELDLPNTPHISPSIVQKILNKVPVNYHDLATVNDFKLVQAAWIYDLNFPASLERVYEKGYLQRLAATMERSDQIQIVFSRLEKDLNNMINEKRAAP